MTREETKKLLGAMICCYPNYKPSDMGMTVDVWTALLSEYDYKDMSITLQAFVTSDTTGFPPSIGQLINKYQQISTPSKLSPTDAWTMVSKALRSGSHKEAFDNLPELVQKAVGSPTQLYHWSISDEKSVETIIASQFKKSYEAEVQRDREYNALPGKIQAMIQTNNLMIGKNDE